MGINMEPWYAADGGGGGGTPAPDPKDVARDESIHRSAYLIQGTPVASSHTPAPQPSSDTSETGMPAILESLQRLTGFTPPTAESEDDGS